ncbi:hypothetical protein [Cryobacterium gelidum]|nr:hypothetical protein [Cryobacterium gelidum]
MSAIRVNEVHHGGNGQRRGEQIEEDHSFSTPHPMTPTSANTTMMPST